MYMIANFAVVHPVAFRELPLSNARTSAPFLTMPREIRERCQPYILRVSPERCHTYILRESPFIDSHHTIGLVYFPTAIPPELAFTGIHCFKILFPAIDPYVSSLVVLQSLTEYSTHLLMSLKSVLPPLLKIRLLISSPSYSVVNSFKAAPTVLRILISTSFVPKNVTVCPTAQLFSVASRTVPLRVDTVFTMS